MSVPHSIRPISIAHTPPAGLTRGSTSRLPCARQDVGARIKSGHGDLREWRELMAVLGRENG